jgi:hypothetical protein
MSDMRGHETPEVESGNTGKIVAAVAVALMIGAAGAYTYGTGMWNSPPKQVLASLVPPSTSLPPSVVPTQQTVVPPLTPVESTTEQASPPVTTVPPVRATRTHVLAHASPHSPTVQPSESFSNEAPPAPVPQAVSVPEQPVPPDTNTALPMTTPSLDAPTQPVAAQPVQTVPVQPAPQP